MSLKEFQILQEIGSGAFANVYKVRRIKDNQIYALKKVRLSQLSDKEKQNSLNQIRILASVKSSHIISYKEAFIEKQSDILCLITEYADGGDLQNKLTKMKSQNTQLKQQFLFKRERQVWKILISIAKGLKALHSLNIAHRDIKPANVFLFKDGRVKIGDMNVSKITKGRLCETQTGTPYYASPQIWKDIPYNTQSDVWSLGCLIYEICALHPPFEASSMQELYKKVLKGIFPKLSSKFSKKLKNIIRKMIQVNPEARLTAQNILELSIISQKNERQNQQMDSQDEMSLIETIKIPRKLAYLSKKLPTSNYHQSFQFSSQGRIMNTRNHKQKLAKKKTSFRVLPALKKNGENHQVSLNNERNIKQKSMLKIKSEKTLPAIMPSTIHHKHLL